jgi:hypothetical protein
VHLLAEAPLAGELGEAERVARVRDDVGRRVVREALRLELRLQPVVERVAVACLQLGP